MDGEKEEKGGKAETTDRILEGAGSPVVGYVRLGRDWAANILTRGYPR
jgi:hypothetical protein